MGLTYHEVVRLRRARDRGAAFDTALTIGRQQLYLHPAEARKLALSGVGEFGGFADAFLRQELGVRELVVLDASDYEGATLIADMNQHIDAEHEQRFDAVIDCGSLEHIFNVPTALSNLIRMARTGGLIFLSTPANNFCGHGFYQFSPELMFRVFNETHGCVVRDISLVSFASQGIADRPALSAHRVTDPDRVGERVGLTSRRAAMLVVEAEKIQHLKNPLGDPPQQSDYSALWTAGPRQGGGGRLGQLPVWLRGLIRSTRRRRSYSLRNRRFYERV